MKFALKSDSRQYKARIPYGDGDDDDDDDNGDTDISAGEGSNICFRVTCYF
jgi:hypothetical protein